MPVGQARAAIDKSRGISTANHQAAMRFGSVYLALNYWTRLHGLICMEVLGHLSWALDDAGA